jgi:hypothetical protein
VGVKRWFLGGETGLLLVLVAGRAFAASSSLGDAGPRSTIAVRSFVYARLPAGLLSLAETGASRILAKAGLETEWLDCSRSRERPGCLDPLRPNELTLRILRDRRSAPLPVTADAFGFALVPEDGSPGVDVGIFFRGWSRQDLKWAAWGRLVFTEEEAWRLRAALSARTMARARPEPR